MKRRDFLKRAGATSFVLGMGNQLNNCSSPSRPYEHLVPELYLPYPDPPARNRALVIGSGFGGAIAAYRLAQAGQQVAILERGSRWPSDPQREIFAPDFKPDGRGFWFRNDFTDVSGWPHQFDSFGGVLDVTDYPGLEVWRGAAVGGGSVVFTGALVAPEQRFFEPLFAGTGVGYAEMRDWWYPLVRTTLGASPMPDDIYADQAFAHSRIWDEQARNAGLTPHKIDGIWRWDIVRAEIAGDVRPSAIIGLSNLGNSNGAKRDLNQTYLRWAQDTGNATIHPGHHVNAVGVNGDGTYWVEVEKRTPTGEVVSSRRLECDTLYMAAGSIGTSELLVAAKHHGYLPNLNDEIGQGWGSNGDAALARAFSFGGLSQGAPSRSRFVDESGPIPITMENWYVPGLPVDLGVIGSLGMTLDPTRGKFVYDAAQGKTVLDFPTDGQPLTVEALRQSHNKITEANNLIPGVPIIAPDINTKFTAHPLGGAIMGRACDTNGRVHGHPGLYVMDGALMPGSAGLANPSLTISALAERNIQAIIAAGH